METHPIFESDFDCLTEKMLSRTATRIAQRTFVIAPIQTYGVSGSYASAAYSAAVTQGTKDAVAADLSMLSSVFENGAIADYFADPFCSASDKLAALDEVAGAAGLSETTVNLFGCLAENNRLNILNEVATVYARIIEADSGSVPCEVVSAIPLTAEQQADVAAAINGQLEAGQSAKITTAVDAELMGGMTVSIGDKYTEMKFIDMSVASKVKKYTELLRQSS